MSEPSSERTDRAGPSEPRRRRDLRASWRRFSRSHLRTAAVAILGASVAAAYAYFVGCRTGTCPLTSNVWTASLYGAAVGAIVGWPVRHAPDRDRGPAEGT